MFDIFYNKSNLVSLFKAKISLFFATDFTILINH